MSYRTNTHYHWERGNIAPNTDLGVKDAGRETGPLELVLEVTETIIQLYT